MAVGSPGAGRRAGCAFGAVRLPAVPVYRPALPPVRHDPGLAGRPAAGLFRRLFLPPAVPPGAAGAALRRPPGGAGCRRGRNGSAPRRWARRWRRCTCTGCSGSSPPPSPPAGRVPSWPGCCPLWGPSPPEGQKKEKRRPAVPEEIRKRGGAFLRAAAQARGRFTLRPPGGREPRPVPLPGRQSRWNTRQGTRRWSRFSGCCPVSPGNGRPAA